LYDWVFFIPFDIRFDVRDGTEDPERITV